MMHCTYIHTYSQKPQSILHRNWLRAHMQRYQIAARFFFHAFETIFSHSPRALLYTYTSFHSEAIFSHRHSS